jgi:peroxiredoxin Q/BCP
MAIVEGTVALDIELPDQEGKIHTLSQYRGKWLLLYFYPKDDTPGCIKEACGFRDAHPRSSSRLTVLGVSADSIESHQKFAAKYDLPFTLLSDPQRQVINLYGATPEGLGKRVSFLIDPEGVIRKIYTNIEAAGHAEQVLRDIK